MPGSHAAHVISYRFRNVEAAPSEQLLAPGDIRVFPIGEKVRVEEIVPVGSIDPESVMTPAIFVHRIVQAKGIRYAG